MGELSRPKLVKDWVGGYVRSNREISNGYAKMPAGTIYKVGSAGIVAHLESVPCERCGIAMKFSIKGRNKFDGFEWLGKEAISC